MHDSFKLKYLGIDSYQEAVVFLHVNSLSVTSGRFEVKERVTVELRGKTVVASVYTVQNDMLGHDEVGLCEHVWHELGGHEGDEVRVARTEFPASLRHVRAKLYGHSLDQSAFDAILKDVVGGLYNDVFLASFVASCAGSNLTTDEILVLARSMVNSGSRLTWNQSMVMDKHCVGGLPGNRTTLLVVPIVAAFGLAMPKTSSRAITSPAGTADTMEVFCPVTLEPEKMRSVVASHGGCIVWGGTSRLSPADDIFIKIERALDLDSVGLMIASVLSKKVAAGSNHVVIDLPIGMTAKIRSHDEATRIGEIFQSIGLQLGLKIALHFSDGSQPVGRGIGPALEARDVLAVLLGESHGPADLRDRALSLAGKILELSGRIPAGRGKAEAGRVLNSGKALAKFMAICNSQGGFHEPPVARLQYQIISTQDGMVADINNRKIATAAKIAGAPRDKAAGIEFLAPLGKQITKGEPLLVIHAESQTRLQSAVDYLAFHPDAVCVTKSGQGV